MIAYMEPLQIWALVAGCLLIGIATFVALQGAFIAGKLSGEAKILAEAISKGKGRIVVGEDGKKRWEWV